MSDSSTPDLAERRALPPTSYEALRNSIAGRYPDLSRRLQQVAEYALAHPDDMALETIAVIADRAGVPPSSLIRFAKALAFEGFSDMQRLFRARLVDRAPSYGERIRSLRARHERADRPVPSLVLDDFVAASIEALERLRRELPPERLDRAVQILARVQGIYVAAQRRSFPVAAYISYLLSQLERRSHLLDSIGGMLEQQARAIGKRDALIAVSFRSYAPEILALLERCAERGVPTIVITDGPLSPLTPFATVSFEVIEAEVETFRSLSASMCLALVLVVALGHRLETARSEHSAK